MTIDIEPKNIVTRPEASQTFTAIQYVVTYDNDFDNGVGLDKGKCVVQFTPLPGSTLQQPTGLPPMTITGTADWTDAQVTDEICRRLGVTKKQ